MEFRFGQPWLLLLLLILPTLWAWQQLATPAAVRYAPARIFEHGLKLRRSMVPLAQKLLIYTAATCLLLGLARPQSGVVSSEVRASGIDIRSARVVLVMRPQPPRSPAPAQHPGRVCTGRP